MTKSASNVETKSAPTDGLGDEVAGKPSRFGRFFRDPALFRAIPPVLTLGALLAGWEIWVRLADVPRYLVPRFSEVASTMWVDRGTLLHHSWVTLQEVLIGYGLSIAVAIPIAVLIVSFKPIEQSIYPLLIGSQVVPKIAIAPLLVIWFGFGLLPKILLVFLISFFPIVINSVLGFRSIETEKLYLAKSMGAGSLNTFLHFRFPNALPNIFVGLKLAGILAVIGAVVAELVGANAGLGYLLVIAQYTSFQTSTVFASIGYLTFLGIALFMLLDLVERLMLPWHVSRRSVPIGS